MKFLSDGLSMNEAKVSALVVGFFLSLGFALWQFVVHGDITDNMLTLLGYLIMAITGVNVAESVAKKTKGTNEIGD